MTENPDTTSSTDGYEPGTDQDSDPDSLAPRTGAAAIPSAEEDPDDPDADPDMLNPRQG